jgi:hypothetical protein
MPKRLLNSLKREVQPNNAYKFTPQKTLQTEISKFFLMNPEADSPMMALLHIFGKPFEIILGLTILQVGVCVCVCVGDVELIKPV